MKRLCKYLMMATMTLDPKDPIEFDGHYIVYDNKKIILSEKSIYVDGSLSDEEAGKYPYVYNSMTEALSKEVLIDGTEAEPMNVYIAPYVYWIHDPAATDTVQKTEGYNIPYGMIVDCEWLALTGLTKEPGHVVIAGNRGQSHGANGNYTMFHFEGDGLKVENLTMGNYCSVDLVYDLLPELSQVKRTSAITQAQIADLAGDKLIARNCDFISRLNLTPINGGKRSLYDRCHFESTDDALNGSAVYLECDFDFYGNRPLYSSYNTGSVFLNCKFNSAIHNVEAEPVQYFTKEGGVITAVDCEYMSDFPMAFSVKWTKYPLPDLRCYQYNIQHNDKKITIAGEESDETVEMAGLDILDAYKFIYNGKAYYNTYNLLKGADDWDPMGIKSVVKKAEIQNNKRYTELPTLLRVQGTADEIESGQTTVRLTSEVFCFDGTRIADEMQIWSVSEDDKNYVKLIKNDEGTYTLEGSNTEDEVKQVIVEVKSKSGLEGAVAIDVKPTIIEAPAFIIQPRLEEASDETIKVNYELELSGRGDQSLISWYRCTSAIGENPVLVAVSRMNSPKYEYALTAGDVGYYIMAKVEPKHLRSYPEEAAVVVSNKKVKTSDVKNKGLITNFMELPSIIQSEIKLGFWTVDYYRPLDTEEFGSWSGNATVEPWQYGTTGNGCIGSGLYQGTQGARLMYTPVKGVYDNMTLKLVVDPAKTAGQGFGSADQYMDICIKFDTATLSGYALRIVRTKAASNACSFFLVKYENGITSKLTEPVISSCYATGCEIIIEVEGSTLKVHAATPTAQLSDQKEAGWVHSVELSAEIATNPFGGIAIIHTGTPGTGGWQNTTMLHELNVEWK